MYNLLQTRRVVCEYIFNELFSKKVGSDSKTIYIWPIHPGRFENAFIELAYKKYANLKLRFDFNSRNHHENLSKESCLKLILNYQFQH